MVTTETTYTLHAHKHAPKMHPVRASDRGNRRHPLPSQPNFYVFPRDIIQEAHQPGAFSKVVLRNIADSDDYLDCWDLIADHLGFQHS